MQWFFDSILVIFIILYIMSLSNSRSYFGGVAESHGNVKTFILPEECFANKAALVWRCGNKFSIYPRSQTREKNDSNNAENMIVHVRQEVILFHPILRQLVSESNGTFINVQKLMENNKNTENNIELLKASRQYRSIVRICLEYLQEAIETEKDGLERNNLESYTTILIAIECIWHLCEILYIDSMPGDVVLPSLLEWVRFHFPNNVQIAAELLDACEHGSETNEAYWDTIVSMIVQGRVDVGRALLKLHSANDSNEFKLVDHALKTMPVYGSFGGMSTGEFTITWKHWQSETRAKLVSGSLPSHPQLQFILRLVIGDYTAFEVVRTTMESWYELLPAWVMYSCPWIRRYELSEAAHACAGMRTGAPRSNTRHKHLDVILLSLCECDLHQVIHEIQNIADNGWFATHLTDLLVHCGKLRVLDHQQNNVTSRLRESLILEYGSLLFEHKSLWSVGLSYLAGADVEGRRRAELLLERLPILNDKRALKIISEAKRYELRTVAQSVTSRMCWSSLKSGSGGASLSWALRARVSAQCGAAATSILSSRQPMPHRLLLSIGPSLLLHRNLLFLGKYCEFQQQYKGRHYDIAGKLLVSLISAKIAPDFFWDTLLLDTLPLLESDEIIFTAQNTYDIMEALELRPNQLDQEKADLLRLALTRNLARAALVCEQAKDDAK